MMSGMRLFVSLEPPPEAVEHLEHFLEVRRQAGAGLRWSATEQWHLTLAFMGSAPERVVEDVVAGVAEVAARTPPPVLAVVGGGCFPDVTRARVLWAGLDAVPSLVPLAGSVRSACAVAGGSPEGGPFRPHLTLARLPRPTDATRWVRVLETYAGPVLDGDRPRRRRVAPAARPWAPAAPRGAGPSPPRGVMARTYTGGGIRPGAGPP